MSYNKNNESCYSWNSQLDNMKSLGLVRTANFIQNNKCKQCEYEPVEKCQLEINEDEVIIPKKEELNIWSFDVNKKLKNEQGKWTQVYNNLPSFKKK